MRADIHGGQEHKRSVQGPDTEAQDLSPPNHHFPLATRGRSIQKCHKRTRALRSGSMTAPSERHAPAHPPSPDVEAAADTTVFTASAERAATEGHGHASRCAPGPSLQERHGSEADDRRVVP